jgi:hypothetical protein
MFEGLVYGDAQLYTNSSKLPAGVKKGGAIS